MNGATAKKIRRYSLYRYRNLSPEYRKKISPRGMYRLMKRQYYRHGRSFARLIDHLQKPRKGTN